MNIQIKSILLIFFVACIIYSNSLSGEFVYDDEYFVVKNVMIRNLENAPLFFTSHNAVAFSGLAEDVYRPIATLSYAVDFFIWKFDTFGYHLTNLIFHSLNSVLLFLFIYYFLDNIFIALFTALFFACHPIQTEAVTWISGRGNVLFLFFYLLSFIGYAFYLKTKKKSYWFYSLGLYALSLFSKEMSITLPLVLIAYDIHFPSRGGIKKKIIGYTPYFILTGLFLLIRSSILERVSQCGWWGGSPYYTFLTMMTVMTGYLKLLIAPIKLCAFYLIPVSRSCLESAVLVSIAVLLAIGVTASVSFRKNRLLSFAIWFFFITLLPVSNIVPLKALMAERFLYLPSIGYCLFLSVALLGFCSMVGRFHRGRFAVVLALCLASLIVFGYSIRTMMRNEDWKDPITLSKRIVEVDPLNPWGYASLGSALSGKERYTEAIKPLQKAISLSRDYASPKNILGVCYLELDKNEAAIETLTEALKLDPKNVETMSALGIAYAKLKKYDQAVEQLERSIKTDPRFISAYLNLAAVYERLPDQAKALKIYQTARMQTNSAQEIAMCDIRMGDLEKKMGESDKARKSYESALQICSRARLEQLERVVIDKIKDLYRK